MRAVAAYRPDLDGLRAIAVIAVVLFHAKVPGFSGGYVGVDVFFVISGYLITGLISENADRPLKFWLPEFYIRRARRILPALFATCVIVAVPVIALYLPWDLARFGSALAATPVMMTNIVVWRQVFSYFRSDVTLLPISHLWSIAVEEQFYLIYPLTLALISQCLPRNRHTALFAIALASFTACVWGSYYAPSANYFLAPSRAWELLLGAMLAIRAESSIKSLLAREMLAALGLVTLIISVWRYDATTRYPGAYSLAPCAASALLILSGGGPSTLVSRLLSRRPLAFTGLISYSLYLWHFPILIVFPYFQITQVGSVEMAGMLACTYLIAAFSWRYVEMPVRNRTLLKTNRSFLLWMGTTVIVILAVGMILWRTDGLPWRYPSEFRSRQFAILHTDTFERRCVSLSLDEIAAGALCSYGPQDESALKGLVWGDSHAMALLPAYRSLATEHHMRLYIAMTSSCRPLLGITIKSQSDSLKMECMNFNAAVEAAIHRINPSLLILNAHWIDNDADLVPQMIVKSASSPLNEPQGVSNFTQGLLQTLRATAAPNRSVCVVLDVPVFSYDVPYAVAVSRKRGISEDFLKLTRADAQAQYSAPEIDIRKLAARGALRAVDPKEILCRDEFCLYEAGGQLLYRDSDHVTPAAAKLVSSAIEGCF